MPVRTHQPLTLAMLALTLALSASCSAPPSEPRSATKSAAPAPDPGPIEPITDPVNVTGAYLVGCSAATKTSYTVDISKGEDLTACMIHDAAGNIIANAAAIGATIQRTDGSSAPAALVPKDTTAPWLLGFKLPPEELEDVAHIAVAFTVDGQARTAETATAAYSWATDPVFFDYLRSALLSGVLVDSKAGTPGGVGPAGTSPSETSGGPETATTGGTTGSNPIQPDLNVESGSDAGNRAPAVYVLLTTALFDGSVTVEAADKECAAAGLRFKAQSTTWQAVLALDGHPPAERLSGQYSGVVRNARGELVAESLDGFWGEALKAPVLYDELKHKITAPLNAPTLENLAPLEFNQSVWTGVGDGSCSGWTSRSSKVFGASADATSAAKGWLGALKRACARRARLLCIGAL